MKHRIPFLVITCLIVAAWISPVFSQAARAQGTTLTFTPVADAYVIQTYANSNYGSNIALRVDNSPYTHSYLRFEVHGLNGASIQSVKLRMYANSSNGTGYTVKKVSSNTWLESSITYANAPVIGSAIKTAAGFSADAWTEVDLTGSILAEGTYSIALTTTSSTSTNLAARESGAHAPQLVIVTSMGSSTAVPSATAQPNPSAAPTTQPGPTSAPTLQPSSGDQILLLGSDIAKHNLGGTDYTANAKKTGDVIRSVLAAHPDAVVQTMGDNVNNDSGTAAYDNEYKDLYTPTWGSFLSRTHNVLGNHDTYPPSGTLPFYNYFTASRGVTGKFYYSYNLGSSWHVIVLNAQCSKAGGCGVGTPQYNWLKADLAANTRKCVLAVWHQPRWTSGRHADDSSSAAWWDLLYQYKADIVANGHNHNYERFNLIDPSERAAADGIREFIVGTGGAPGDGYSYSAHPLDPNEAVRNQNVQYGVLQLTLKSGSYDWKFLPAAGSTFTDSGTQVCH